MADHGMIITLLKGIPILQHMRTKKYLCLDNVLCTATLQPYITKWEVNARLRPAFTDHFSIVTNIDLPHTQIPSDPSYNFRTADWDDFKEAGNNLTQALLQTIEETITRCKPCLDAKRWWNRELSALRKEQNILRSKLYKNRAITKHPSHRELRRKSRKYEKAILIAKKSHWTEYLEEMSANNI